jgi:aldehyde dehydrogenase
MATETVPTTTLELPREAAMLIGGRAVQRDERIRVVDPARTHELVGTIPVATEDDVHAATRAAQDAWWEWSQVPMPERAAALRRAAEILADGVAPRAELLSREAGQLLSEGTGGVAGCGRCLLWYADLGERFEIVAELPSPNGRVFVHKEPMGVAALIVPWNAPTYLAFLGLAPILLAGNTVVVKPPSDAPLALIDLLEAIAPAFPEGTINVVTGGGATVGRALVTDPLVRKIMFTGSTEAGRQVLRDAADTIKRVSLELGGNDPAVVLADADLDRTVPELISGVFAMAGQVCYDVKRIYVDERIRDDFVQRYTDAASAMVVGRGLDPRSSMGALVNETQLRRIEGLVAGAERSGATVRRVGEPLDDGGWDQGWFHLPTIVSDLAQDDELVQCEQFGPAIPILGFGNEEEAVALANDTRYGLAASVWTEDEAHGFEVARRIQAGTSFINIHRRGASGVDMPFGGFKESGLGRGHGVVALEEQFELHTVSSRRPA